MGGFRINLMLARRFLLSKASGSFLSLISWISVLGVSLGVLALVTVTSVINGFEGELVRVITGMNSQVVLFTRGTPVSAPQEVEDRIHEVLPQVDEIAQSFVAELMVAGKHGVRGAVLEGFDPAQFGKVTRVPQGLVDGRMPATDGEVALTTILAEDIGARLGDKIRIIAPFTGDPEESSNGMGVPKAVEARVVGLVRMGMYQYDSKFLFATLPAVQAFLDQPGGVNSFKITLKSGDPKEASDLLSDNFGYPFKARDWSQFNRNILYAIKLEKVVIGILLTAIIVVAAFNVVSSLMMMIYDKSKEIAILKAVGFSPGNAFGLFCIVGLGIGVVGTITAVLGGVFLLETVGKAHIIDLPPEIYYVNSPTLPILIRWGEVALIAGLACLVCFFATLYPSVRVAKRAPLDGLRYD